MSRGLSEEGEDPSLSETADSDVEMESLPDETEETEAVHTMSNGVTRNIEHPIANGHLTKHELIDTVHSLPAKNENREPREIPQKAKERYYATFLATMNESELDRYEAYRRSCLPRPKMKKLLSALSNLPVHDDKILIVLCSLTKMFVGQIVQESRSVASEMGESGPLRPQHVRKAFKKLESEGTVLRRSSTRSLFRHFA